MPKRVDTLPNTCLQMFTALFEQRLEIEVYDGDGLKSMAYVNYKILFVRLKD